MLKRFVALGASIALAPVLSGCGGESDALTPEYGLAAPVIATADYKPDCGVWQTVNPSGREEVRVSPLSLPLNTLLTSGKIIRTSYGTETAQSKAMTKLEFDDRLNAKIVTLKIEREKFVRDAPESTVVHLGSITMKVSTLCHSGHGDFTETLGKVQKHIRYESYQLGIGNKVAA